MLKKASMQIPTVKCKKSQMRNSMLALMLNQHYKTETWKKPNIVKQRVTYDTWKKSKIATRRVTYVTWKKSKTATQKVAYVTWKK